MKKQVFFLLLFLATFAVIAQEKEDKYPQDINKKHELKINAFSLIGFTSIDISYEYLITENASYGMAVFYNLNNIENDLYFPKKLSLTPYYRWFFSEKRYARGFFVEGFGMLNTYEDKQYFYGAPSKTITETDFALGISVGGKFILKSGFIAEIYLGIGRNLFNNDADILDNNLVTRGGISLGYRF